MKLLEKILVPIDIDSVNENQIKIAEKLSKKFNSELEFLHVLPLYAYNQITESKVESAIQREFKKIKKKHLKKDSLVNYNVVYGNIFDQIMEVAEHKNVNLILMGNNLEEDQKAYKLGINAEKIIRKSTKPVWIAKNDFSVEKGNILCPVDFSEASKRALDNAIKIARIFNMQLHIINVFETIKNNVSEKIELDLPEEESSKFNENEKRFNDFLNKFNFTDVDYSSKLILGNPHKAILNYANENRIELLFMGTTGKSMISRILMGSVTESIARELPCSLITTKSANLFKLKIDADISHLEEHFELAKSLEGNGYYQEAITQIENCLNTNDLHVPSLYALSRLYSKIGDEGQSKYYESKANEVLARLWDKKIELEIRKGYSSN